jgi:hypothetical protein
LEVLITKFQDIFTSKNDEYGRTDRVCHLIDSGDASPMRQTRRRLSLAKEGEVYKMRKDMKERGVIED